MSLESFFKDNIDDKDEVISKLRFTIVDLHDQIGNIGKYIDQMIAEKELLVKQLDMKLEDEKGQLEQLRVIKGMITS